MASFSPSRTPTRPLFPLTSDRVNRVSGGSKNSVSQTRPQLSNFPSVPNLGNVTPNKKLFIDTNSFSDDPFTNPSFPTSAKITTSPTHKALPELPPSHSRNTSDVQGMVARFNSLDIKDHVEMRKKDAAALKRALVGREEAESDARKLKQKCVEMKDELEAMQEYKQETRVLRKDLDDAKERERKIMKRLDVMMEELHRAKETQAHSQSLYEKEIRKARKEAFKSSSALVKMQEELRASRNSLRAARVDLDLAKAKANEQEQEAFKSQYQLVGIQEELNAVREKQRTLEEERDALKASLEDEEVARIAAEGRIALPSSLDEDDEFASPKKEVQVSPVRTPWKHGYKPPTELDNLRKELTAEKQRRETAEDQIDFMKMECQFRCCSCRLADKQSASVIHEKEVENSIATIRQSILRKSLSPAPECNSQAALDSPVDCKMEGPAGQDSNQFVERVDAYQTHTPVSESPSTEPIQVSASLETAMVKEAPKAEEALISEATLVREPEEPLLECQTDAESANDPRADHLNSDSHDQLAHSGFKMITTTTTVPLVDASSPNYKSFFSPSTPMTREQAIEQLRLRRGRARSVAGTPKKPVTDTATTPRRDISAPEVRAKKTPKAPTATSKVGSLRR